VSVNSATASLVRSPPATTFLSVGASPLVASAVTKAPNFQKTDTINLNLTGSRDPDVAASNKSGIQVRVFCYPQTAAATYEPMDLDQMLTAADIITNNRSACRY